MSIREELVTTYVGPNVSHRIFRTGIANAKAVAYILVKEKSKVLREFLAETEEAKKLSSDGKYAIGLAGGGTKTTMQIGICLTGDEVDIVSAEPGGFSAQALGLVYREVYRSFETYLIELFEEIARQDKRVLYSDKQISHEDALRVDSQEELLQNIIEKRKRAFTRGSLSDLEKQFNSMGLPVIPLKEPPSMEEQEAVLANLRTASAIRNVIEHNDGFVDAEFLSKIPGTSFQLGEKIVVSLLLLGEAFSSVQWAADQINKRAIEKFKIADVSTPA